MLAFVPVAFDVYRPLKPRLRWAMQCLVSFADRTGRCFPSVRKLAAFAGLSKSAVSRHLRDLVGCGAITRQRRPGGVYDYQIDPRFLPRAPVSHQRAEGVPQKAGQETDTLEQTREARTRARFAGGRRARARDSQIEGSDSAIFPTIGRNGKLGCAAGARVVFGYCNGDH